MKAHISMPHLALTPMSKEGRMKKKLDCPPMRALPPHEVQPWPQGDLGWFPRENLGHSLQRHWASGHWHRSLRIDIRRLPPWLTISGLAIRGWTRRISSESSGAYDLCVAPESEREAMNRINKEVKDRETDLSCIESASSSNWYSDWVWHQRFSTSNLQGE